MTTQEQNELLTHTGSDSALGKVFRRYWIPALMVHEIAEPDGAPVRVQLLSERLIAFRDSAGRIGLIDEFCAHRRASLWFGRNEENGLRCPYHGWKFYRTGQCVNIPSEPEGSRFCEKVKLKSYPCLELGGVVWTYMGPAEHQPPVPEFEWMRVPEAQRHIGKRLGECNFLQAMEGGIDSSHVSSLHSGELMPGGMLSQKTPQATGTRGTDYLLDPRTKFEVLDSPGGMHIGASRRAAEGQRYWRVTQWIMPWYTMIPPTDDQPLSNTPMSQADVYRMIGRRAAAASVATKIGCHSFRATGITEYLRNGGKLEVAQQMANHESARTTGLYDRRQDQVSLDEVERILI